MVRSAQYQGSMIEVIKHENTRMLREERRGGDKKVSDIRPTEREREERKRVDHHQINNIPGPRL